MLLMESLDGKVSLVTGGGSGILLSFLLLVQLIFNNT
jgi:hypothetical protein